MKASRLAPLLWGGAWALIVLVVPVAAHALEVVLTPPPSTVLGSESVLSLQISGAVGTPQVRWTFGDGTESEFEPNATSVAHTYDMPGHYTVVALVQDDQGYASQALVHAVHRPLTPQRAQSSAVLLFDEQRGLILTANSDNGTVSVVDATKLEKIGEIPVFSRPVALAFAPDGLLWAVDQEDYAVAIVDLDARRLVDFFRLPYASLPAGLVFAEDGDAYVPLMALGEVVRINAATRAIVARQQVAPSLRGIGVSGDGTSVFVTRFISQGSSGEVFELDAENLQTLTHFELLADTTTEDSDVQGRGLPNYLFSVAVTPDGTRAWVPSKKDNMPRGLTRDGLALTQDSAVRPLISVLDLESGGELFDERIDLDDRNLPTHVAFNTAGDWAFVSVFGSNLVELRDGFDGSFITALRSDGMFGPIASLVDADDRLLVLADLARKLFVFDVADLMNGVDQSTKLIATIPLVDTEKLSPQVLEGKQLFTNAEDKRMAVEGYLSCASCHFDGFEDGMVWDFTDRGEGVRNTISMLGRRGTGHGRVHWTANFDEIQDFDGPIRVHQAGTGFIPLEIYQEGTRSEPLGDPKAGLDPDLDAIAAYVTSLGTIPSSPYRNPDGTLTDDALVGRELFVELGCGDCHSGDDFTDSSAGVLHDVGTLTELSGSRLGGELTGLDTPTLLGVWQTAPYLHDGSAPTLRDVLTTRNTEAKHGDVTGLSQLELDQLIAYLQQLDQGIAPRELTIPVESGAGGAPTQADGGGGSMLSSGGSEPNVPDSPMNPTEHSARKSGGCTVHATSRAPTASTIQWLILALLAAGCGVRKTRRTEQ